MPWTNRPLIILLGFILVVYLVGMGCCFLCSVSHQQVYFFLKTSPPVLYQTLSSNKPWDGFLKAGKQAIPLQYHDQTNGLLHNTAYVAVINHPWHIRWWGSDQFALGSLPPYLTQEMKIISETSFKWNPKIIVLNRLDKNATFLVNTGNSGQYVNMERAVRSVKDSKSTLLVYPEGSHAKLYRNRDSPPVLAPFKTGIFRAIYKVDVPVIPIVLPLEWQPGAEDSVAIEILPSISPTAYTSAQEFTSAVYNAMLAQLLENKKQKQ